MLGILIGVGSVIVLVAVGNGSSGSRSQKRIEGLGTNTLVVMRARRIRRRIRRAGWRRPRDNGTQSSVSQLTEKDVDRARGQEPGARSEGGRAGINEAAVTATYSGATYQPGQFVGTNADYLAIRDYTSAAGAAFTNDDVTGPDGSRCSARPS